MEVYIKKLEVRWADLDPNFHVLHSRYYDYGAFCRMSFFNEHGLTPAVLLDSKIGPIIFREECFFKKEIKFGDELEVNLKLSRCNESGSRWSMTHEIWTNQELLAAVIHLDGAWLDTQRRKLATPPELFKNVLNQIPKTENFIQ